MITIIILVAAAFVLYYLFIKFGREKLGTMTLYHGSFISKKKEGASLFLCYAYALRCISHRSPINELSEAEFTQLVETFSKFSDPQNTSELLQHALKTERVEFLREPYLTRLVEVGRKQNVLVVD